jgi:hypothetical protein
LLVVTIHYYDANVAAAQRSLSHDDGSNGPSGRPRLRVSACSPGAQVPPGRPRTPKRAECTEAGKGPVMQLRHEYSIKLATWLMFAVLVGPTSDVSAKPVYIEGPLDCGQWITARSQGQAGYVEHYVLGVLNGLSVGLDAEFWHARGSLISREAAYLWVDNYCRQHPLGPVVTAALALFESRSATPAIIRN